jgi:hypothetical protein
MTITNRAHIDPTLFIGLGGAGGQVLGRLRRLFATELQADGGRESPVQFLLLDADDFRKLDPTVRESLDEQQEFRSISHFNPRQYLKEQREDHRSDLHRWFDWEVRSLLEDAFIHDGASRLRLLGRLCLHRHYYEVERLVAAKITAAESVRAHVERGTEIRASERPFRVLIISSTLGGTGSAIFLDVVYMVNRLIRQRGATPEVVGFLFLPDWYVERGRQVDPDLVGYYQANAWAFFEELNHVLPHPQRLAEIALDPGRPNGSEPSVILSADYEPIKTLFVIDSTIPNAGRFQVDADWYNYVAQGMFQIFLAPEEGALETVYSNIKTKLGETDSRFSLKKRFAAFGYADLRHPGDHLRHFLGWRAATEYARSALLGSATEAEVQRAADDVVAQISARLDHELRALDALQYAPLDPSEFIRLHGQQRIPDEAELGRIQQHIEARIAEVNARLPSRAGLDEALSDVRQYVEHRLAQLAEGLHGERRVLETVRTRLLPGASPAGGEGITDALQVNAASVPGVAEILGELARPARFGWGGPDRDPARYMPQIGRINDALARTVAEFCAAQKDARRSYLLQRIAGTGSEWLDAHAAGQGGPQRSVLGAGRERLARAAETLARHTSAVAGTLELSEHVERASLTTRYYPEIADAEAAWRHYRPTYDRILTERSTALAAVVGDLYPLLFASDESVPEAALAHLATFFASSFDERFSVIDALMEVVAPLREAAAQGDAVAQARLATYESLLRNVYTLSTPCCRIDYSKLSRGDTCPTIMVGASNRRGDEVQNLLHLPATVGLIDNDGSRFALLQAVYAFPSYAVAGMAALQESYLRRDRKRSFPHLCREWNEAGLDVSRQGTLTDGELLQFVRMRALNDFFAAADGSSGETSGIHLLQDTGNGATPPRLLHYASDTGGSLKHLHAHAVVRLKDSSRFAWQSASSGDDLGPLNVEQNIRRYVASPAYEAHASLLGSDIHQLEHGSYREAYAAAYAAYRSHLEGLVSRARELYRDGEAELFSRMAELLRRYVEDLDEDDLLVP